MLPCFQLKVRIVKYSAAIINHHSILKVMFSAHSIPSGFIAEVAMADDHTRHFVQERLRIGCEEELRLGLTAALKSFQILINDENGSCMLQGECSLNKYYIT